MPWREQLKNEHAVRASENLWRKRTIVDSPQGREVSVGGTSFLNFCSNDYLGLTHHPDLVLAATETIRQWGTGAGSSHLVCGHLAIHHQLESELAEFVGAEQAIVFSTGYMANLAIPTTLLGRNDLVLEDRLNHASLIDAGRLCEATMKRYSHVDCDAMEKKLARSTASRKMILTDGVFSMDGDIAPLERLHSICEQHRAMLVVDDAHGFGILGERGSGSLELAGIRPTGNVIMVGTFGKSLGSFGAFIAGDEIYLQTFIQTARPYIYTTALPPSIVASTRAALGVIKNEPQRRAALHRNIRYFRESLQRSRRILGTSSTPIQPLILGSSDSALKASQLLKQNGIWVSAIRPPTVPVGSSRLRITLTAEHRSTDIDRLVETLDSDPMTRIIDEGIE